MYERRRKGFSSKQLPRVKKCRGRVGVEEVLRDLYMVINATAYIQSPLVLDSELTIGPRLLRRVYPGLRISDLSGTEIN